MRPIFTVGVSWLHTALITLRQWPTMPLPQSLSGERAIRRLE